MAFADAQTGSTPSGSASGSVSTPSGSASGSVSGPSTSASGSTSASPGDPAAAPDRPGARGESRSETRTESAPPARSDDGSALPRAAVSERTTIFGLSPTAAVIIAAALLVVVILAIVAMTRSNDTYIDTNRRV
ncbi:MAG TPA: hypothetical protein VFV05_07735 [Methylomirabilota bacterium]|nr:hypothetical protein [Methylomirabilota bacterium]